MARRQPRDPGGWPIRGKTALTHNGNELRRSLPPRLATFLALLAALFIFPLASAARSHAFIYWTDFSTNSITRASLDGTYVDENFISGASAGSIVGLAADADHIYWPSIVGGSTWTISRANLDGTEVDPFFIIGDFTTGLAVDAHHIYWGGFPANLPPSISRANLDGTAVDPGFITAGANGFQHGIAVDASYIFWTNVAEFAGSIGRANLDGSGVDHNFITTAVGVEPAGIAVNASHIYWANRWGSSIGRANLDGTGVDHNFIPTTAVAPEGVALSASHVYWANHDSIARANLDGTGVDQSFIPTGIQGSFAIAVDSGVPSDAATDVIVKGKTRAREGRKEFVVQVSNLGTSTFTVSPDDVAALVAVDGIPTGTVAAQNQASITLAPGAKTQFGFEWTYSGLVAGDPLSYEACVSFSSDVVRDNNCDSAPATVK
jgi:hypothetical protein